jgi:hypothetical protein
MTLHPTAGNLQIIVRIAVFRGLKPETVQHIIAPATAVTLKAHSVLFRQLSRAFAKLRSVGVAVHAAHVAVNDVAKLRRLATDERSAIRGTFRDAQ